MPNFLAGLLGTSTNTVGGSLMGALGGGAITSVLDQLFGSNDHISNRDYQFYQDLADSGNPREISRQRQFLEEMAPSQAAAYNTYQDSTYGADSVRQGERINTIAETTGMSPWEIAGSGGASVAAAPPPQTGNNNNQMLSSMVPLKIAEMNNKTSLMQAALQSDTARTIAAQQTDNGLLPKSSTALNTAAAQLSAAQKGLAEASTTKTNAETVQIAQTTLISRMKAVWDMMPETHIDTMIMKSTYKTGWQTLAKFFSGQMGEGTWGDSFTAIVDKIPSQELENMSQELLATIRVMTDVTKSGVGMADDIVKFLRGLTQ